MKLRDPSENKQKDNQSKTAHPFGLRPTAAFKVEEEETTFCSLFHQIPYHNQQGGHVTAANDLFLYVN